MTSTPRMIGRILLLVLFAGLFFERPAHAYLDPGSGSFFFQIVLGALFSALFSIKLFWANIKGFFFSLFGRKAKRDDSHDL